MFCSFSLCTGSGPLWVLVALDDGGARDSAADGAEAEQAGQLSAQGQVQVRRVSFVVCLVIDVWQKEEGRSR